MKHLTRRTLLTTGLTGLGSFLLLGCPKGKAPSDAREPLAPTPHIDDGDDDVAQVCEPTADNIEGPFFKDGAPSRTTLVRAQDEGQRLALGGIVLGAGCAPLAGVAMEIWHADHRGGYDNDGFQFRGRLTSDADGRWDVSTIIPGRYLNGRRYRPAHIHMKLFARGHRPLTTQLYFEGDPYIDGDPFVVPSLIMPLQKAGDVVRCGFDFVLAGA
jgi:protocatechuate 3,4-dioxygenase beta subunit